MEAIYQSKRSRIYLGIILTIIGLVLLFMDRYPNLQALVFIAAWIVAGIDVFINAFNNMRHQRLMAEHFLMTIATIGAVFIGEYMEAALVIVLYQIGELLQDMAVDRSRESVADLMNISVPIAFRLENGQRVEIDTDEIEVGDHLEIRAGEKIPVDGIILQGSSTLDVSALTGESLPQEVGPQSQVLSGSLNGEGRLIMEAQKDAANSVAEQIIELLEEATENKAETEAVITRFAKVYTPIVVVLAILIASLPPLLIEGATFVQWFERALNFLVISCPCAFVISVPMAFVLGIGASSRLGIIVKGGNVFEALVKVDTLVMDKTGTITQGKFSITGLVPNDEISEEEFLTIASGMEMGSNHPLALAIRQYGEQHFVHQGRQFDAIENVAGRGLKASDGNDSYIFGNDIFMAEAGIEEIANFTGTDLISHLAQLSPKKQYLGYILASDQVKAEVPQVILELKQTGINNFVMLTGDRAEIATKVAQEVGIEHYEAELLPQDKLLKVQTLIDESKQQVAFVGDGLNDAPVLARSNVGIAMGGIGSDAAIEAADVVLMNDDMRSLANTFKVSRSTLQIAIQNVVLSLGIKLIFLLLSAFGMAPMWLAVFADVGVTLLAILNAFRLYRLPAKLRG